MAIPIRVRRTRRRPSRAVQATAQREPLALVLLVLLVALPGAGLAAQGPAKAEPSAVTTEPSAPTAEPSATAADAPVTDATTDDAWRQFYTGRFRQAVEITQAIERTRPDDLEVQELRSSALFFQLKRLLEPGGRRVQVRNCAPCPDLLKEFTDHFRHARALAQARVKADAEDVDARFFLGKLNLNYIWLQLGPLGKRTGWNEYWEARRSLDEVLAQQPAHVRARVARAWIDYIVDTRMPWGTEWLLGGGDKRRALRAIQDAVAGEGERFALVEARFALWEMLMRDRKVDAATEVARRLADEFPENQELATFLQERQEAAGRP
ncbi:MAG: hypothetical protein AB7O32_16655 [Vicinamibacterales bacterium]